MGGQRPSVKAWFQALVQPDTIVPAPLGGISCCGEADASYVDVSVQRDKVIATIDDRDDKKLQRFHEENGTQYVVPPSKMVAQSNGRQWTGRAVIFLGSVSLIFPGEAVTGDRSKPRPVLCFVDNSAF